MSVSSSKKGRKEIGDSNGTTLKVFCQWEAENRKPNETYRKRHFLSLCLPFMLLIRSAMVEVLSGKHNGVGCVQGSSVMINCEI